MGKECDCTLIIENHVVAMVGEELQRHDVIVSKRRPAMECNNWRLLDTLVCRRSIQERCDGQATDLNLVFGEVNMRSVTDDIVQWNGVFNLTGHLHGCVVELFEVFFL